MPHPSLPSWSEWGGWAPPAPAAPHMLSRTQTLIISCWPACTPGPRRPLPLALLATGLCATPVNQPPRWSRLLLHLTFTAPEERLGQVSERVSATSLPPGCPCLAGGWELFAFSGSFSEGPHVEVALRSHLQAQQGAQIPVLSPHHLWQREHLPRGVPMLPQTPRSAAHLDAP